MDISEIIKEAIEEERKAKRFHDRRQEISEQIAALEKELEEIGPSHSMFIPKWQSKLHEIIEDRIDEALKED